MEKLAVYFHVPFCKRKCAYCDFASFAGCDELQKNYFDALGREIDSWGETLCGRETRSVFFGGGTPSYVDARYIAQTMERLRAYCRFAPDIEVTLEANPGTVDPEKLKLYRECGINRLSYGVQSFDAVLLRSLGRIHTPDEAREAVLMARDAGFDNLSIDLMYALPGQDIETWTDTLKQAVELPVTHISAYSLIVEDGTEMARRVQTGEAVPADDDTVNGQQRLANRFLREHGFERYEISNYAKNGCASRHNLTYWQGGDYLGLGSAAHSLLNGERFANPPSLRAYLGGERRIDRTRLTEHDLREEAVMLETRTLRGLDMVSWRERFGEDFEAVKAQKIQKLKKYGLIELADGFLRLTEKGLELQNSVALELMDD